MGLREDFAASAALEVDNGLPEMDSLIMPQAAADGSDLAPQGRKKKLGLKRLVRRARDDGEEAEVEDHHYCQYKYQQFYKEMEKKKVPNFF